MPVNVTDIDQQIVNSTMEVVRDLDIAILRIDSFTLQLKDSIPYGRHWMASVVAGDRQYGCSWAVLYAETAQSHIDLAAYVARRFLNDLKRTVEQAV